MNNQFCRDQDSNLRPHLRRVNARSRGLRVGPPFGGPAGAGGEARGRTGVRGGGPAWRPQGRALRPGDPRPGAAVAIARAASRGPCGGRGGEPGGRPARALLRFSAPGLLRPSPRGTRRSPRYGAASPPPALFLAGARDCAAGAGRCSGRARERSGPGSGDRARDPRRGSGIRGPDPGPGTRPEWHCAAAPGGLCSLGRVPRLQGGELSSGPSPALGRAGSVPVPVLGGRPACGGVPGRSLLPKEQEPRGGRPGPAPPVARAPWPAGAVADKPPGGGSGRAGRGRGSACGWAPLPDKGAGGFACSDIISVWREGTPELHSILSARG